MPPGRRPRSLGPPANQGRARSLRWWKVRCARSCFSMSRKLCVKPRRSISRLRRKITSVTGAPTHPPPLTTSGPKRSLRQRWKKPRKFISSSSPWVSVPRRSSSFPRGPARVFTAMSLVRAPFAEGVTFPSARLTLFGHADLFDVTPTVERPSRKIRTSGFFGDFAELKPGDYVVHVDHGIGQFEGLRQIESGGHSG